MSSSASEGVAVDAKALRWSCPRPWTEPLPIAPDGPPRLWGRPYVRAELLAAAAAFRRGTARHLEVAVPSGPGWVETIAEALRGGKVDVHAIPRATEERLRGRGEPGRLAAAHEGVVVLDVHDVRPDKVTMALREAVDIGEVMPLPGKGKDAPQPEPLPARVLLVVVGTEPALKKWHDERLAADWIHRRVVVEADALATEEAGRILAERLRRFARGAGLGEPQRTALAHLLEDAFRQGRRGRIAQDLRWAEDVLLETGRRATGPRVRAAAAAIAARANEKEEGHRERITNGRLRISPRGTGVGLVHGLMVYGSGRTAYAIPGRVSVQVGAGDAGVLNVERESKYSGRSFDKGMFLLGGWLRGTFGRTSAPAVTASIAFEQSYGRIDGDSATVAEAVALLSALSGIPVRRDVAVTGAMSQRGEVLPVGSVPKKIEGWWTTCRRADAGPGAGVVIPAANVPDLHLPDALVADVAAGRFHVWAVECVEEAVALLLAKSAGSTDDPDSVYGRVAHTLRSMSAGSSEPA